MSQKKIQILEYVDEDHKKDNIIKMEKSPIFASESAYFYCNILIGRGLLFMLWKWVFLCSVLEKG